MNDQKLPRIGSSTAKTDGAAHRAAGSPGQRTLMRAKAIIGRTVGSPDGLTGTVDDVVFDPIVWTVQHIVVRSPGFLNRDRHLVPRSVIDAAPNGRLVANLSTREIRNIAPLAPFRPEDTPDLLFAKDIMGNRLVTADGDTGRVKDLVVDAGNWIILGVIAATRVWLPSKRVLLPVPWVNGFEGDTPKIRTTLSERDLRRAPAFKATWDAERIKKLFPYYRNPARYEADNELRGEHTQPASGN